MISQSYLPSITSITLTFEVISLRYPHNYLDLGEYKPLLMMLLLPLGLIHYFRYIKLSIIHFFNFILTYSIMLSIQPMKAEDLIKLTYHKNSDGTCLLIYVM